MFCQDQRWGNNWDNIVASCRACNTYKGSKNLKPKNQPAKPTFAHLLNGHKLNKDDFPDKVWAIIFFVSYLIEQPYGLVLGSETFNPFANSVTAFFVVFVAQINRK